MRYRGNESCVTVPANINGVAIYLIDGYCFSNNNAIESVCIEDGVQQIYGLAFYECPKLSSITIPESVTYIDANFTRNCGYVTIFGIKGSYAETYANEEGYPFVAIP